MNDNNKEISLSTKLVANGSIGYNQVRISRLGVAGGPCPPPYVPVKTSHKEWQVGLILHDFCPSLLLTIPDPLPIVYRLKNDETRRWREEGLKLLIPCDTLCCLFQVLHHGQSMRGDSHRFSVTADPEDAYSRVSTTVCWLWRGQQVWQKKWISENVSNTCLHQRRIRQPTLALKHERNRGINIPRKNYFFKVLKRPGLAQLVERLAHIYSESYEFESWQPHLCNNMWGQDRLCAGCQEVSKCSNRGGSWGMYITFASAMQIRQPTLALKPRGDVTRNPKQGYQWPQKWTCVRQKL